MNTLLLRGIVPPMVTPLSARDRLDVAGLERLADHITRGGVSGLFILGTSGEGQALGADLCREVVTRVCNQVRDVPVLVGITHTAFTESVSLAKHAAECGAVANVIAPPYVMNSQQAELKEYLRSLLAETSLPLFLYNAPPLTRSTFSLETVRWAMDQPRIIGLKDSSGDLGYFEAVSSLLAHRPDWSLLIGPEELLADVIKLGGHGGVCGGANLFPKLYRAVYEAARDNAAERVATLRGIVRLVVDSLYRLEPGPSAFIKGIKCGLAWKGICSETYAEPLRPLSPELRAKAHRGMTEIHGLLKAAQLD
jgi:4-hydroxy-tetrahydrodipicolinate synthase